jgi:hypothetical protein
MVSPPANAGLVDQMLAMINEKAEVSQQLNYLQQYIGLTDGIRSRNFVYFTPRKKFLYLHVNQEISDDWSSRSEEAGLPASQDGTLMTVTIEPSEFSKQQSLIRDLLIAAVESYQA